MAVLAQPNIYEPHFPFHPSRQPNLPRLILSVLNQQLLDSWCGDEWDAAKWIKLIWILRHPTAVKRPSGMKRMVVYRRIIVFNRILHANSRTWRSNRFVS
jgi:hypothetical protein